MHNDQDTNDLYAFAVDLQLPSSHVSSGITPWLFSAHVKSNSYPSFHYFLILFFFSFLLWFLNRTIILSLPKASLLEAAINSRDIRQISSLLSELRQQTFYHLLFRSGGQWKERKRIDRHGNYVSIFLTIHCRF